MPGMIHGFCRGPESKASPCCEWPSFTFSTVDRFAEGDADADALWAFAHAPRDRLNNRTEDRRNVKEIIRKPRGKGASNH